jgi:hypothetical protein
MKIIYIEANDFLKTPALKVRTLVNYVKKKKKKRKGEIKERQKLW